MLISRTTVARRVGRIFAVVLLSLGAIGAGFFWFLPRVLRRNLDRVRRNRVLMRVLAAYNGARLTRAGGAHSATAILSHVGRRSARTYQTPLGACAYGDGFVVSLGYGTRTDWYRNLMAAGGGRLTWKGRTYDLDRPELISGAGVRRAWPASQQIILKAAGIDDFVWLHRKTDRTVGAGTA